MPEPPIVQLIPRSSRDIFELHDGWRVHGVAFEVSACRALGWPSSDEICDRSIPQRLGESSWGVEGGGVSLTWGLQRSRSEVGSIRSLRYIHLGSRSPVTRTAGPKSAAPHAPTYCEEPASRISTPPKAPHPPRPCLKTSRWTRSEHDK